MLPCSKTQLLLCWTRDNWGFLEVMQQHFPHTSSSNTSHIHLVVSDIFACVPMRKVTIWKCYLIATVVLLQHSSFLFYFQCLLKYQWYFDVVFGYLCLCSRKVSIWKCYLNDVVVLLQHSIFFSDFQSMSQYQWYFDVVFEYLCLCYNE